MTPTPKPIAPLAGTKSKDALLPPTRPFGADGRSLSAASFVTARPSQSYARGPSVAGSFSGDLRSFSGRGDQSSHGEYGEHGGEQLTSEQRQAGFRDQIDKEMKIKIGTENLLEALNNKNAKQAREQRKVVELELNTSNRKLARLQSDLEAEIKRSKEQQVPSPQSRLSQLFRNAPVRSPSAFDQFSETSTDDRDPELESPTYILAEILQALEAEDMQSDYYVGRANDLVDLFKRHPTLKYDLAWSIFGLRIQMMLLSDSREVVAAGYRVMRHAITDQKSLQIIRALRTDLLVILSLVKESKARVEREQALKFIRAFLDVKGGTQEMHPAVVRVIVAVAEHPEDQLRGIAILTLAELLIKDSVLAANAGAISVLSEAMGNDGFDAPETLIDPFLHLMDTPARRGLLSSGFEFSSAFASLTEPVTSPKDEARLHAGCSVITAMFKSWPGLLTLSLHNFLPIRSIVSSLYLASLPVRTVVLDLLIDILRIKSPSWSTPFIGGRRLTTYGRVTNMRAEPASSASQGRHEVEDTQKRSLVRHHTAVALAILLRQGLLEGLLHAESDAPSQTLKRRTSLLITEVLRMASELLPPAWSQGVQTLPHLFNSATDFTNENRFQAVATVYQVDSINRTLYRSTVDDAADRKHVDANGNRARAVSKTQLHANLDETQFRTKMIETGVLHTVNYQKWDWPVIQDLIDGPLVNPKRLQEAMVATKFVHRLLGFLRPFKYRFSEAANTKSNQRYVRMACSLVKTLLQTSDGTKYLESNKLVPQIGECLAQLDPMSGITAKSPLFSVESMTETLAGSYFAVLGVMCSDTKGMYILEKWRIINIFYHIIDLRDRDDLIRALLLNMNYSLDSHPRIMLSKTMTASSKQMRISATKILRKYAIQPLEHGTIGGGAAEWAIKLLVGQLYDPDVEVCEVAIKILEEACENIQSLQYVVRCRPALDHLGEIGAPLLLRFLSTSIGYHYLDGLDYITKEMDDWFLGRNDTYVAIVETSLARALTDAPEQRTRPAIDDALEPRDLGYVPPHFYRELTRTAEGCELLKAKGHFEEFAMTIREHAAEAIDAEIILKVKGCLWAVGNVGSMDLGAPFLDHSDVVSHIVGIAEKSQVMTLRGTAFFVLGLISRSLHGQEILLELGWDGIVNATGESLGYVLPLDFTKLFASEAFAYTIRPRHDRIGRNDSMAITDDDPTNEGILRSIVKLGNTVLTNPALAELSRFRSRKVPGLRRVSLFRKAMIVLSQHSYQIPQYRYVIDLFDKSVLRKIVSEEDDDQEEEMDGEKDDGREEGKDRSRLPGDGSGEDGEEGGEDEDEDEEEEEEEEEEDGEEKGEEGEEGEDNRGDAKKLDSRTPDDRKRNGIADLKMFERGYGNEQGPRRR